jgi:hypothetical protein
MIPPFLRPLPAPSLEGGRRRLYSYIAAGDGGVSLV